MSWSFAAMTDKRNGKYRTAGILAVIVIGLFLFTIFSGLK
jgi:hypothetical protein